MSALQVFAAVGSQEDDLDVFAVSMAALKIKSRLERHFAVDIRVFADLDNSPSGLVVHDQEVTQAGPPVTSSRANRANTPATPEQKRSAESWIRLP